VENPYLLHQLEKSNMKKIVFILLLTLAAAYVAFGQCGYPEIGVGVGLHAIDSAVIQSGHTRCTPCPTDGVVSWSLDSAFNGHFFLNSDRFDVVTVQITKGCDYLLFDTCVSLPPRGVAGWAFVHEFAVYNDAQVHVSGAIGQTVYIDVKAIPTPQEPLDVVLMDLTTCNLPTGITEPIKPTKATYFDAKTLQKVVTLEPNKVYIVRYGIY